ncbi:ER membrane protein complex subunit 10-like [Physella acuta]|uniref:ER membrane protein complex subunit 10-like n=1 Tax=Physella acuta TaxID=109671 RepID=UPI0027DD1C3F|nr:ER membrane protein complex subunit 10-like [Physella acuta]
MTTDDEFEGSRTLVLEHSFQSGKAQFTKRGTIIIQSLKGNKAQFTAGSSLSQSEIQQLKSLAKGNGLYKIRIPTKTAGETNLAFVSSVTKACSIVESGLEDEITVHFDQSGEVLGVSIRALIPACSGLEMPDANLTSWRTNVEVSTTVSGPS